jgi:hypothetical protein
MTSFAGKNPPNQGTFKAPPSGFQLDSSAQPGGAPTGSAPKNPGEKYKGIKVAPIGGSGQTISKPKPFKR